MSFGISAFEGSSEIDFWINEKSLFEPAEELCIILRKLAIAAQQLSKASLNRWLSGIF
jgi:hypothetical protein